MTTNGIAEASSSSKWTALLHRPRVRLLGAIAATIGVTLLVFLMLGANPFSAIGLMVDAAVGNTRALGRTLNLTGILILTGLSGVVPFSAKLWNVGGEGQLWMGAIASVVIGLSPLGLPPIALTVAAVAGGVLAGTVWGFIPGVLRAKAGANEVITSLMLSFVAMILGTWVIRAYGESIQASTRPLPEGVGLPSIWPHAGVNLGLLLALVAAVCVHVMMRRLPFGFKLRATGLSQPAARLAGFRRSRVTIGAFSLAGAFGGMAGVVLVVGIQHALVANISVSYGLIGVAVALVARLNPLATIPSAFLFASIETGGNALTAGLGIPTAMSTVAVASVLLLLLIFKVVTFRY